jgi:membrane protein DedA with SNARE-associated domain
MALIWKLERGLTGLETLLAEWLSQVAGSPLLLIAVIIVATFILEDLATVTVALLAVPLGIDWTLALSSLIVGTAAGDMGVYFVARHAAAFPWLRKRIEKHSAHPARTWVERHGLMMIVIARFTPGLRLPVFSGAGVIGFPFAPFGIVIVTTTLIWTPGLFYLASWSGRAGLETLNMRGWLLPVAIVAMLLSYASIVRTLARKSAPAQAAPA